MQYDMSEVMKKLAADINSFVERIKHNLSYDKTYIGTVTGKTGDSYTVQIKNETYHIKTNYPLNIGSSIYVMAVQNDMSRLLPLVTYNDAFAAHPPAL